MTKQTKVLAEEFMECGSCRVKPGSPYLCEACLHNRTLVNSLKEKLMKKSQTKVKAYGILSEIDSFNGKAMVLFPWAKDTMEVYFLKKTAMYNAKLHHGKTKVIPVTISYSVGKKK